MKEDFQKYLISKGYKIVTPAGHPSTVYDYTKRIDYICDQEQLTWEGLSDNISKIISLYGAGGQKQYLGEKSHRSVINALKRFFEFLDSR